MTEENTQETTESYRDMTWQKLKALMTAEGQEWQGQEHAIEYLESLDAADEEVAPQDEGDESTAEGQAETAGDPEAEVQADSVSQESDEEEGAEAVESNVPAFNPEEKHGVISGRSKARYWQNGCHYDTHGNYIKPEDV